MQKSKKISMTASLYHQTLSTIIKLTSWFTTVVVSAHHPFTRLSPESSTSLLRSLKALTQQLWIQASSRPISKSAHKEASRPLWLRSIKAVRSQSRPGEVLSWKVLQVCYNRTYNRLLRTQFWTRQSHHHLCHRPISTNTALLRTDKTCKSSTCITKATNLPQIPDLWLKLCHLTKSAKRKINSTDNLSSAAQRSRCN